MGKKEGTVAASRKPAIDRLDHHEKILHLLIDRVNQIDGDSTAKLPQLREDLDGVIEWLDMGWHGRLWYKIKGLFGR